MGIKWDDVDIMVTALSNEIRLCKSRPVKGGEPDARFAYDMSGDKTEQCVKAVMEYMLGCCRNENAYAKIFTIPGICRLELTDLKAVPGNGRYNMRLPTCMELDTLADIVHEDDAIMHWEGLYSWCQNERPDWTSQHVIHGYHSACYRNFSEAVHRHATICFRPVFEPLDQIDSIPDGTITAVGTFFMDGQPVRVPNYLVWNGDITDYVPGAKLELREALDDSTYQVRAIKVGNILIADRPLVSNISWNEIQEALDNKTENS